MDFFDNQEAARRNTSRLILLYVLAVASIIASVYLVLIGALMCISSAEHNGRYSYYFPNLWNEQAFFTVAGITLVIVVGGSLYKMLLLAGGGAAVAQHLGGRLISPNTSDAAERRVLNIVEEMAIASGISVPPVYLLGCAVYCLLYSSAAMLLALLLFEDRDLA